MLKSYLRPLFIAAVTCVFFSSCEKEKNVDQSQGGTSTGRSIIGKWKFVGNTGSQATSIVVSAAGQSQKIKAEYAFISFDNSGFITFTDNQMIIDAVAYKISTEAHTKVYENNVLVSDDVEPLDQVTDPYSETHDYKKVGSDSLAVVFGPSIPDVSGTPINPITGLKIGWSGDTLLLKAKFYQSDKMALDPTSSYETIIEGASVLKLVK